MAVTGQADPHLRRIGIGVPPFPSPPTARRSPPRAWEVRSCIRRRPCTSPSFACGASSPAIGGRGTSDCAAPQASPSFSIRNDGAQPLKLVPVIPACALTLAACGAKSLELPADPVDRAATCGVVAAAAARTAVDRRQGAAAARRAGQDLPLCPAGRVRRGRVRGRDGEPDQQAHARARGGDHRRQMAAISSRSATSAFPATAKTEIELPSGRFEAQIACEELAEFTSVALEGSESAFRQRARRLSRMRTELNDAPRPGPARPGRHPTREAQSRERDQALAAAAALGSPIPVLDKCIERFK